MLTAICHHISLTRHTTGYRSSFLPVIIPSSSSYNTVQFQCISHNFGDIIPLCITPKNLYQSNHTFRNQARNLNKAKLTYNNVHSCQNPTKLQYLSQRYFKKKAVIVSRNQTKDFLEQAKRVAQKQYNIWKKLTYQIHLVFLSYYTGTEIWKLWHRYRLILVHEFIKFCVFYIKNCVKRFWICFFFSELGSVS